MSSWKKRALFLSAILTLPRVVPAVTVTLSFDMNDFYVSNSRMPQTFVPWSSFPGATLTGTASAPVLSVPGGDYVEYGLDATVTNNNGLGLEAFQIGLTDSAPSVAGVLAGNNSSGSRVLPVTVAPYFISLAFSGYSDGAGGIENEDGVAGAYTPQGPNDTLANVTFGAGAPANLYSALRVGTAPAGGQAQFTPSPLNIAFTFANLVSGTLGAPDANYNTSAMQFTDSFAPMPVLTIKATQLRPIALIFGNSNVDYHPYEPGLDQNLSSKPIIFPGIGISKGIVGSGPPAVIVGTAVMAMKLDSNGIPISAASTMIASIVSDINNEYVSNNAAVGTTGTSQLLATTITGNYASEFPASDGWDILLTWNSSVHSGLTNLTDISLGFDFTQEEDYFAPNITVTALVGDGLPEPTLGMVGIVGMGLLARRRVCRRA